MSWWLNSGWELQILRFAQDDALEIAAGDAAEIEEDVLAMLSQVQEDRQRPRNVGAAIAEKNGLLDALHTLSLQSGSMDTRERCPNGPVRRIAVPLARLHYSLELFYTPL